jgi:lysozyme
VKTIYKIGLGVGLLGGLYFIYRHFIKQKMSLNGLDFLIKEEGFKNSAYKDSKGIWTIGVGHKIILPQESNLLTKTLTNSEVRQLLKKDLKRFEDVVNDSILFPLPQNKFDSLVSLAFNIGESGFKNSTLAKRINSKLDDTEIIKAFSMWNDKGLLINRRAMEARLFITGNYSNILNQIDLNSYYKA